MKGLQSRGLRRKLAAALAVVVGLAAMVLPSGPVEAGAKMPQARLIYQDSGSAFFGGPGVPVDKEEFERYWSDKRVAIHRQNRSSDGVTIMATKTLADEGEKQITPPGGSTGPIDVLFEDTLDYNLCCTGYITGESRTRWFGATPFDADEVTLTDKWTFRGVSLSVSVSGRNWSVTGNLAQRVATWTGSIDNDWRASHSYDDFVFDGFDIWVSHNATGEFRFGSSWYEVNAYDSTWL